MSKFQRLSYMVVVRNGQFVKLIDDSVVNMDKTTVAADLCVALINPATGKPKTVFASDSKIYACDKAGNLFITGQDIKDSEGEFLQLNHSTLLAGKDVLCAGTISIKNGKLRGITNMSGHYKPDTNALHQILTALKNEGTRLEDVFVLDMSRPENEQQTEATLFLRATYGRFPLRTGSGAQQLLARTT
jgi:hypothetical protein